jgi:hypothetical protein
VIPRRAEIASALTGAWWLFLRRAEAMRFFDVSVDGFWRSFGAIWLVLPGYAVIALAVRRMTPDDPAAAAAPVAVFVAALLVRLAVDWVALPLLLALVARPLGIAGRYVPFIVARNWATVLAVYLTAVASLIAAFPGLEEIGGVLMFAVFLLMLRYFYLVARIALDAGIGLAVALVVVDFAVSTMIELAVSSVFGV